MIWPKSFAKVAVVVVVVAGIEGGEGEGSWQAGDKNCCCFPNLPTHTHTMYTYLYMYGRLCQKERLLFVKQDSFENAIIICFLFQVCFLMIALVHIGHCLAVGAKEVGCCR
jgi:hypothetical protein